MADLIFQGRQAICRRLMDAEVERDKLTPEQRGDFARFAWEKGRTAALDCQAAHPGLSPTALAERLGVPVARRPGRSAAYSQYEEKQRQIVLFGAMVATYAEENKRELGDLPAEEIFVAHELFHFLECTDPAVGPTWRQREVTVFRLGPLHLRSGVRALSEIAAHAFALTYLGLPAD